MMRTLALLFGALMIVACDGVIDVPDGPGDPNATVAQLTLYADELGALLVKECVTARGEAGCARYPSEIYTSMKIKVRGDGRTCAEAVDESGRTTTFCGGAAEGIPLVCHAKEDFSCQQCTDIYGNKVLDNCADRGAQLFSPQFGAGWNISPDSAWLGDGSQTATTPTPPTTGTNKCDSAQARLAYAKELNKILGSEGLKFSYSPDLSKVYNNVEFWKYDPTKNKDACKYWLTSKTPYTQCWSNEPGKCHCAMQTIKGKQKPCCKCGRINVFALRAACQTIPTDCNYEAWVGALVMEYGVATAWLFSGTYTNGNGGYAALPSTPTSIGGTPTTPEATTPPTCLGSPLVFDLGDDGIQPTSPDAGVRFDLLGHGSVRTAWVQGNDALLVLDRNGNGRIDDGTELFGEGTLVDGAPAEDGFAALAQLDQPAQGGNGNGLLEAGDLMFSELRLWTDLNHDGISQPEELQPLERAKISSIDVRGRSCGQIRDAHGNDLSLRSSFTRADGRRGLVVDVYFAAR
jgi:hypothetical protein